MGVCGQVYATYSFIKTIALVALCLAFAIKQLDLIDNHWTQPICDECYLRSRTSETQIEFKFCSEKYTFNASSARYSRTDKLLWSRDGFFDFKPISSYNAMVWLTAIIVVLIICFGCCFFVLAGLLADTPAYSFYLVSLSWMTSFLIFISAQYCFSLVLDDGCYVAAASKSFMTATSVFLSLSAFGFYGNTKTEDEGAQQILTCCNGLFQLIYGILVLVIASNYSSKTGDSEALLITLFTFLSLLEAPAVVFVILAMCGNSTGNGV